MDQMGEELKKVLQAGMGAVATGVEKTQEVFDKLSKKGEPLYQQAKKTVSDAVDSVKQAVAGCGRPALSGLISALRQLSPEERALIREALLSACPEDSFYGEEGGGSDDEKGRWIVDPIDGTMNYIKGLPNYSVSIAYERDGKLAIGCVYVPDLDEIAMFRGVTRPDNLTRIRDMARRAGMDADFGGGWRPRGNCPFCATGPRPRPRTSPRT